MDHVVFALWFFLAGGIANLIPVFAAHMPILKELHAPVDFGRSWRAKRILGDHKTWRGIISGTLVGTACFGGQIILYRHSTYLQSITPFDMSSFSAIWIGLGLSLGALLGDAVASFFKRQRGIDSGKAWFPFDQSDFVIGGLICSLPFVQLPLINYALILIIWVVAHLAFKAFGYFIKINETII